MLRDAEIWSGIILCHILTSCDLELYPTYFTLSQGLHSSFLGFKWFMWAGNGRHSCRCRSFARMRWVVCTARSRWVCDDADLSQIANLRYAHTIFMHPTPGTWHRRVHWPAMVVEGIGLHVEDILVSLVLSIIIIFCLKHSNSLKPGLGVRELLF